jgi:ribosomal protein L21E
MVKRSRGTLVKHTKRLRRKKKLTIPDRVKKFVVGDSILIDVQPVPSGLPSPRYQGKQGRVKEKRGSKAYVVEIKDGRKKKELVVSAVHLRKIAVTKVKE